jgi:MFS family permease
VLDTLTEPFGTSAADVGLLISAFTAPGIVMIPVGGAVADRYGRKPVLVASLVLFGLAARRSPRRPTSGSRAACGSSRGSGSPGSSR